jgi:hypothetical protein
VTSWIVLVHVRKARNRIRTLRHDHQVRAELNKGILARPESCEHAGKKMGSA